MKMKPTHKDFYMEIRKSPGRFLSILFIVALGVAFFSGIRASEPDMRLTGDAYFDESNLMDIKALSTYGVTQDDVDAISKIDGVEHAEGAYSADFMQIVDKKQKVLHVISLQDEMNQVKLSDGQMPQKAGECLADQDAGYKVGDTIKLRSGTSDEVTDTLTTDTLKVVGLCSSPMYISYGRGSATIGTGTISAFVMVPEETFDMDVYTEVYVQVKGAKNEVAFTDGYDKKVQQVLDSIQDITDDCGISRMTFYYHFKDIYDLVEWACIEDAQKVLGENRHYDSWEKGLLDIFKAVRENKPFILNVYHSVSREQIETYLYQLTYQLMIDVVEEKAVSLRVSTEDKDFIADFYKYALVGLMLDWIKKDMREDPQDLVNRLAILVHGNIVAALQHYDTKGR